MATNKTIQTVPFNFDELYTELKEKFNTYGYDVAEGSNVSMLNTSMAYMTSMLNANTAVNINENILAYAQKRENVLQDARTLGYEIKHIMSYVYDITINVPAGRVIIPKFTSFSSNGHTYYYTGPDILVNYDVDTELTLRAKEGTLHKYTDEPEVLETTLKSSLSGTSHYYIDIPYTNVEHEGIEVYVSYYDDYDEYHDHDKWSRSTQTILEQDTNFAGTYLRIDNIDYGTPRIYFKYAGSGSNLSAGTTIDINVIISNGPDGEIDASAITCDKGYTITNVELIQTGQDAESVSSIKANAPKVYNSANRLVVSNDYEGACKRDTRISDACVWGGEKEFPVSPGHVWFSFLKSNSKNTFTPSDDTNMYYIRDDFENNWDYVNQDESTENARTFYENFYLQNTEIQSGTDENVKGIWDTLTDLRIPTLEYHHRNPIFCLFDYDFSILKYSMSDDMAETHQTIFDIVKNAFIGQNDSLDLEQYNVEYFDASIVKRIDAKITDISGFKHNLSNKLVLNTKTLAAEQLNPDLRDIYIPLGMPYENIFDENGFLNTALLPNIDTENFITYTSETGANLYVDWCAIEAEQAKGMPQSTYKLIVAPIKCNLSDTEQVLEAQEIKDRSFVMKFRIYPDDCTAETLTYDRTTVTLNQDGVETILTYGADERGYTLGKEPHTIIVSSDITVASGDKVTVSAIQTCGYYYIFNSLKQEILVHLFVDGSVSGFDDYTRSSISGITAKASYIYTLDDYYLYTDDNYYVYTEAPIDDNTTHIDPASIVPKSYIYSSDGSYFYTVDDYYLTTAGYALYDPNKVDTYTGSVVRKVTEGLYYNSPLKSDLFYRNRFLNVKYASNNFKLLRNVIPMLHSVTFKDEIN